MSPDRQQVTDTPCYCAKTSGGTVNSWKHKKRPRRAKTLRGNVLALSIFPGRCQPSIVDRNELNYRVRNGNGWTLILISTNSMSSGTARKQTILYCPSRLLSRLFQVFHLYPHRETSVSASRRKRMRSPVLLALQTSAAFAVR